MTNESEDIQAVERLGEARDKIVTELRKTIVGMDEVIDEMMIAIFARGHCLLVGVPGLAKTLSPYLFFQEDVPPSLVLKPNRRRWPGSPPAQIITEIPKEKPTRTSDASAATLVRGVAPERRVALPDRETELSSESGRATVSPSAVRVFGSPQSKAQRKK